MYIYVYINVHVHMYNGPFSNILNFRVKKILQGISRNLKFFFQLKVFLDWLHAKFVLNVGLWRGQDFIFPLRNSVRSPRWAIATRAGAPQLEIESHPDKWARGRYNTSTFHIPARPQLSARVHHGWGLLPLITECHDVVVTDHTGRYHNSKFKDRFWLNAGHIK